MLVIYLIFLSLCPLLLQVETAEVSAPLLSLLCPIGFGEKQSYWRAPVNVSSVEFAIVLGRLSDVFGVAIVVSSCGYSASNCPTVRTELPFCSPPCHITREQSTICKILKFSGSLNLKVMEVVTISFKDVVISFLIFYSIQYDKKFIVFLQVEIWASNKIIREERSFIGKWDVKSLIQSSSSDLFEPEEPSSNTKVLRNIKFHFPNPIRCRIICIKMSLSQLDSSPSDIQRDFDLLSFENSFVEAKSSRGIETDRENAFIHAKRIIVFGKSLRPEIGQDASSNELLRMRSSLNRSPQLSRFRV
jgi:hypothetical protein